MKWGSVIISTWTQRHYVYRGWLKQLHFTTGRKRLEGNPHSFNNSQKKNRNWHPLIDDGVACLLCAKRLVVWCAWRVRENSSTTQLTMFQQPPSFTIRRYQFSVRFEWVRIRSRGAFILNRKSFSYSALLFFLLFFPLPISHKNISFFSRWFSFRCFFFFGYVSNNVNKYIKRNFEIDECLWLRTVFVFFVFFLCIFVLYRLSESTCVI